MLFTIIGDQTMVRTFVPAMLNKLIPGQEFGWRRV